MATIKLFDFNGKENGTLDVRDEIFAAAVKPELMNEIVQWQRAKARSGNQSALTKGEVRGTNKKPSPQKGRGAARQGSQRNPHFVGGGVAFAPKPRSYAFAMPGSKRRAALASALSVRLVEGGLRAVSAFDVKAPKTGAMLKSLVGLGVSKGLIVDVKNDALRLSLRNLSDSKYLDVDGINVMDILRFPELLISENAVKVLQERLLGE